MQKKKEKLHHQFVKYEKIISSLLTTIITIYETTLETSCNLWKKIYIQGIGKTSV